MIIHLHVHIKQSDAKNSICQFVLNSFELLRGWASQRTPVLNERDDKTSNCKLITCNSIPNILKAHNLNVHFPSICCKFWASFQIGPKNFKLHANALTNRTEMINVFTIRWSGTHHYLSTWCCAYHKERTYSTDLLGWFLWEYLEVLAESRVMLNPT